MGIAGVTQICFLMRALPMVAKTKIDLHCDVGELPGSSRRRSAPFSGFTCSELVETKYVNFDTVFSEAFLLLMMQLNTLQPGWVLSEEKHSKPLHRQIASVVLHLQILIVCVDIS